MPSVKANNAAYNILSIKANKNRDKKTTDPKENHWLNTIMAFDIHKAIPKKNQKTFPRFTYIVTHLDLGVKDQKMKYSIFHRIKPPRAIIAPYNKALLR